MDFIKSYLKTENGYCVERSLFCTKLARNSEQAADESHKQKTIVVTNKMRK